MKRDDLAPGSHLRAEQQYVDALAAWRAAALAYIVVAMVLTSAAARWLWGCS